MNWEHINFLKDRAGALSAQFINRRNGTMTIEMKKLSKAQSKKLDGFQNVSTKIRYLDKIGFTRGQISKVVNRRYQQVRNTLNTPVTNPAEKF